MGGVERIGNFDGQFEHPVEVERCPAKQLAKRMSFQAFHSNEEIALLFSDFVDSADIWMVQRRRDAGFATEPIICLGIAGKVVGEEFEGNEAS